MNLYAVIMAGGVGARFWPKSREKTPKQLLKIFNEHSLLQNTYHRLNGLVKQENIYLITNKIQSETIKKQLPGIPNQNIIEEPFGKNTAACIGLATSFIQIHDPDALTLILPADHLIVDVEKFQKTILRAAEYAFKNSALVTIGINPTRPETGYGYIQADNLADAADIYDVKTFAEKPNLETAKRFLEAGDFFWNSGMFIWKASTIMNELKLFMPELYEGLSKISSVIGKQNYDQVLTLEYGQLRNISIDYGIMEHSQKVYVIKGEFDWNDVGNWEAVYQLSEKGKNENVVKGDVYLHEVSGSYIETTKGFTAVLGVDNLIVIETDDALLICDRKKAQSVKLIVDNLKLNKKYNLL
ncbi:MAG: mannose-1-phosphate guanylyltransferase [Melioribacteraceae bacterium]|nr:mannose-1-phosphate guanylyltransferase [Melioribacteraceae bacterium]